MCVTMPDAGSKAEYRLSTPPTDGISNVTFTRAQGSNVSGMSSRRRGPTEGSCKKSIRIMVYVVIVQGSVVWSCPCDTTLLC